MRKNKELVFFQCLLCAVLVCGCFTLKYRENTRTVQVSGFGYNDKTNDTFSDLAENMLLWYEERSNEKK